MAKKTTEKTGSSFIDEAIAATTESIENTEKEAKSKKVTVKTKEVKA